MAFINNFSTPPDISLSSVGYNQSKCVIYADLGYPSSLGIHFGQCLFCEECESIYQML